MFELNPNLPTDICAKVNFNKRRKEKKKNILFRSVAESMMIGGLAVRSLTNQSLHDLLTFHILHSLWSLYVLTILCAALDRMCGVNQTETKTKTIISYQLAEEERKNFSNIMKYRPTHNRNCNWVKQYSVGRRFGLHCDHRLLLFACGQLTTRLWETNACYNKLQRGSSSNNSEQPTVVADVVAALQNWTIWKWLPSIRMSVTVLLARVISILNKYNVSECARLAQQKWQSKSNAIKSKRFRHSEIISAKRKCEWSHRRIHLKRLLRAFSERETLNELFDKWPNTWQFFCFSLLLLSICFIFCLTHSSPSSRFSLFYCVPYTRWAATASTEQLRCSWDVVYVIYW